MKYPLCASVLITVAIFSTVMFAQDSNSFEINGGIILPASSSNGINASIQYNYQFNNHILFYIYTGYSSWDKFNVYFAEQWSTLQTHTIFSSFKSDSHILIPVYAGSRINVHTNKFFTAFLTFEIGYAHLSYNDYQINKEIDPVSKVVLSYQTDRNTKREVTENLIGIGAGIGISRQLIDHINLVLSYKLNNHINSKYYDFLSSKATYSAFNLGLNFSI